MSQIGNTEALEKYLLLEKSNSTLLNELRIYREELASMRKAYSELSDKVCTLYQWLDNNDETAIIRRRMAELFKFAFMEANFKDLRDKWANKSAIETAERLYKTLDCVEETKEKV